MSYLDCIRKAKLSAAKKAEAEDLYRKRYEEYTRDGMNDADADFAAGKDTADALETLKAVEKKRKVKTIQAQRNMMKNLGTYAGKKKDLDFANAAIAMFEKDHFSKFPSIDARKEVIKGQIHAQMTDFLQKFEPKFAGTVRPKAGLNDIVKEMFGESSGNESAKELAGAVSHALETLRQRANRAGANIGKRENFGMPQRHDRVKIAKISRDKWVEFTNVRLDWEKMLDPNTGLSIPVGKRFAVLQEVYDTIVTEGYSKLRPGEMQRLGALDKRLANHRFLEFRDGKSWIEYQDQFGVGTPFDVLISHIDKTSRDVALMEILGPNPNTGKETLKALVKQNAGAIDASRPGGKTGLVSKNIEKKLNKIDELYATVANTNVGASEDAVALTFGGVRNIITSAVLGSATLLAVPGDMFTKALTKGFSKMPGTVSMGQYLKLLNPADKADKALAIRSGLIAESATSIAYGQQRFLGMISGPQWTRRLADITMRASLMTPHTQAARWAFGMEALGMFADNATKKYDELPFKAMLNRHGITSADWDIFRATEIYQERGASFLRPDDVRVRKDLDPQQAQDLADKFMEMIVNETNYAVPTASLKGRTFLVSDSKPGTLIGEVGRSLAMFKNFPVTVMFTHVGRALSQRSIADRFAYITAFGIGMTTMGALGLQARQIAQGKDPLNMNPTTSEGRKFWANAALAGGGLAIWGDFLFQDVNRFGGGIESTIAGPVFSALDDARNLTIGNMVELAQGKDTNFAADAVRFTQRYMPGGSIWYLRLALQREIFDQLLVETDPDAASKFRRLETNAYRDRGQEYFWGPGKSVLRGDKIRTPDLEAAID